MAADTYPTEPRHDGRGSQSLDTPVASSFDPSLDPTIRSLFEQQAAIQAKLAALLPAKHDPNSRLELDMLRHKLRALEAYAENQSQSLTLYPHLIHINSYADTHTHTCMLVIFICQSPGSLTLFKISPLPYGPSQKPRKLARCSINANALRAH